MRGIVLVESLVRYLLVPVYWILFKGIGMQHKKQRRQGASFQVLHQDWNWVISLEISIVVS